VIDIRQGDALTLLREMRSRLEDSSRSNAVAMGVEREFGVERQADDR